MPHVCTSTISSGQNPVALHPFPDHPAKFGAVIWVPLPTSGETGSPMCGITDDGEGGGHP